MITISRYCYNKGMTMAEFRNFENNIKNTAVAIVSIIKTKYVDRVGNGMFYPVGDILTYTANSDVYWFIIQELKKLGVEFIDDCKYYRY